MRISKTSGVLAALSLCASACGDADNDERGGSGASAGPGLTTLTAGDTDGEDQGDGEDQADGDADGPGGDADGPDGDADDDGNDADGGVKYDTNTDDVVDSCDGMMTGIGQDFSYIWIANSPESTISKINTQTLVEEGRYVTRDTPGNPSRTSVALSGHVAVANRSGGVTKYHAWGCDDPMNTSTGPNDVYAFGADGCLAWSTNMVYNSQRPVAWTPGVFNDDTCAWEEEMVWTAGYSGGNTVDAILLDGETGVIVQTIAVNGVKQDSYGAYGGASDSQGNFWFSQLGDGGWLVRVTRLLVPPSCGHRRYGPTGWRSTVRTGPGYAAMRAWPDSTTRRAHLRRPLTPGGARADAWRTQRTCGWQASPTSVGSTSKRWGWSTRMRSTRTSTAPASTLRATFGALPAIRGRIAWTCRRAPSIRSMASTVRTPTRT